MLDGAAFAQALPQLGIGGLLMAIFALLVMRGPLYLERRNEAKRDRASIEAGQYERMDTRTKHLEERCDHLEQREEECRRELADAKGRIAELEGWNVGRGRADNEAQMIVSTERQADAAKKGKDGG